MCWWYWCCFCCWLLLLLLRLHGLCCCCCCCCWYIKLVCIALAAVAARCCGGGVCIGRWPVCCCCVVNASTLSYIPYHHVYYSAKSCIVFDIVAFVFLFIVPLLLLLPLLQLPLLVVWRSLRCIFCYQSPIGSRSIHRLCCGSCLCMRIRMCLFAHYYSDFVCNALNGL